MPSGSKRCRPSGSTPTPCARGVLDGGVLVDIALGEDEQAGRRRVADGELREASRERAQERRAAARVLGAHPAQVAVELAALEEVGERELGDHVAAGGLDRAGRRSAAR